MKATYQVIIFIVVLLNFGLSGCKVGVTMSGASIPVLAKTVSVQYISNQAPIVQPTLSQRITEALKDKIISQTRLEMVSGSADLNFEGVIQNYSATPQMITGNEQAATNRLTITVKIKYTNTLEPKTDYDASFSRYADFPSDKNLDNVDGALIDDIIKQLIDDIFNKAFVNW